MKISSDEREVGFLKSWELNFEKETTEEQKATMGTNYFSK